MALRHYTVAEMGVCLWDASLWKGQARVTQGCTNPGRQVTMATKFWIVAPNAGGLFSYFNDKRRSGALVIFFIGLPYHCDLPSSTVKPPRHAVGAWGWCLSVKLEKEYSVFVGAHYGTRFLSLLWRQEFWGGFHICGRFMRPRCKVTVLRPSCSEIRGLSRNYPAILNTSRTARVAWM